MLNGYYISHNVQVSPENHIRHFCEPLNIFRTFSGSEVFDTAQETKRRREKLCSENSWKHCSLVSYSFYQIRNNFNRSFKCFQ